MIRFSLACFLCSQIASWFLSLACFGADGSGSGTDEAIQAWHDLAGTVDGDTYTIAAGSHTIDAEIAITKNVNIIGFIEKPKKDHGKYKVKKFYQGSSMGKFFFSISYALYMDLYWIYH